MNNQSADGVCFYDDDYGVWTGTYVDNLNDAAIRECINMAKQIASPEDLPEDGIVVPVNFTINQRREQEIVSKGAAMLEQDKLAQQQQTALPSFADYQQQQQL